MGCAACKKAAVDSPRSQRAVENKAPGVGETPTTAQAVQEELHADAQSPDGSSTLNGCGDRKFQKENVAVGIGRWGGGAGIVGAICPASTRIGARANYIMNRVNRDATICETYKLTNTVLGTGISGAVRVATHKFTGQNFAIKTLQLQGVGPKRTAMLHNEVEIYLQLDHPNIAKLIEVYEEETAIHLVMELCTGRELYDRLATKRKYLEADAARVTHQMLSAISYCHNHLICHRDLKLENWVYAHPGEDAALKLIDFGFSRIFNPGIPMTAMHGTVYYVSPEVTDGCYGEKCDMWSLGVLVFMLLSGSPPFNGSTDSEILISIKRGNYSFDDDRWWGVSADAKNFVSSLLQKDPSKRPLATEALQHRWLLQSTPQRPRELDVGVLQQMRSFALANIMKRAALGIIAMSMSPEEARDLEEQYKLLDRNKSGTITLQELTSILNEKLHVTNDECGKIFKAIDQTGTHEVHYTEFMASANHVKLLKNEGLIREAFRRFDVDSSGSITVENLRKVLGDKYNGTKVEDMVKFCDIKGNNAIDYEEFLSALHRDDEYTPSRRGSSIAHTRP